MWLAAGQQQPTQALPGEVGTAAHDVYLPDEAQVAEALGDRSYLVVRHVRGQAADEQFVRR